MTQHVSDIATVVRTLVALSQVDLGYADLYLDRAESLLGTALPRSVYEGFRRGEEAVTRLQAELRRTAALQDWERLAQLAQRATEARQRLAAAGPLLAVADAVYGPRAASPALAALALAGVVPHAASDLEQTREATVADLHVLRKHDREWAQFYGSRAAFFAALRTGTGDDVGPAPDLATLQARALAAIDRRDFVEVRQLSEAMAAARGGVRRGRIRPPRPPADQVQALNAPFPDAVLRRARGLGLSPFALPAVPSLNAYLSCACAERAVLPASPLSSTHRTAETCTCGHPCPPEVHARLRDNLDLLMMHPFMTSAGTRYLPWFGPEAVLVEDFAETPADGANGIAAALGLPRRRGLTRLAVENAIRTHNVAICAQLALDPVEYSVCCIPFDVYLRLAPQCGWGRQESWTHFDGYQVTRELHLLALVGGDARYGGPDDLCSVGRDYDSERIGTRFAVVRRQRFATRSGQIAPP